MSLNPQDEFISLNPQEEFKPLPLGQPFPGFGGLRLNDEGGRAANDERRAQERARLIDQKLVDHGIRDSAGQPVQAVRDSHDFRQRVQRLNADFDTGRISHQTWHENFLELNRLHGR